MSAISPIRSVGLFTAVSILASLLFARLAAAQSLVPVPTAEPRKQRPGSEMSYEPSFWNQMRPRWRAAIDAAGWSAGAQDRRVGPAAPAPQIMVTTTFPFAWPVSR